MRVESIQYTDKNGVRRTGQSCRIYIESGDRKSSCETVYIVYEGHT